MSADSPAAILHNTSGVEIGTASVPVRTDPTGTTAQPVSPTVIANPVDTTGTITALNGVVSVAAQGWASCSMVFSGVWDASLVFEISSDGGVTWGPGVFVTPATVSATLPILLVKININGTYHCLGMGATTNIRVRASVFTSGTVGVRIVLGNAPSMLASFTTIQQSVVASLYNSSTTNLAAGATFEGLSESTLGVAAIQVNIATSQPVFLQIQQSMEGTNWDIEDTMVFLAGEGDSRTFQATASFFRIRATNRGGSTTTYFRLQIALCPIVEAIPRALTLHGKLALATVSSGFFQDPFDHPDRTKNRSLSMNVDRALNVAATVQTDTGSFRDDFTAGAEYLDITGTVYFVNGNDIVTGTGTAFLTQVAKGSYIKLSTHADTTYAIILEVLSDTYLELKTGYTGASGSGTGRFSDWKYSVGAGGSIIQTASEISFISGTTSGSDVEINRSIARFSPMVVGFKGRITQRIANQNGHVGIADAEFGSANNQVFVYWDGTSNTTCTFRTSFSSADMEETVITLPYAAISSTSLYYQIEILASKVTLFISDVKVAEHKLHIPAPYASMYCYGAIKNTGVPATTTTVALDTFYIHSYSKVEVSTIAKGDPLSVKELRASLATVTSVVAAVADTALLAANANRLGATVYNDSTATLYLKLGIGASTTSFTIVLGRYDYYEAPTNYVGRIYGYWSGATGNARVTELT